jgi:hypothetical protein
MNLTIDELHHNLNSAQLTRSRRPERIEHPPVKIVKSMSKQRPLEGPFSFGALRLHSGTIHFRELCSDRVHEWTEAAMQLFCIRTKQKKNAYTITPGNNERASSRGYKCRGFWLFKKM